MRELINILLSPAELGQLRWGQYPKSRMSVLSVLSCVLVLVVMLGGLLLHLLGFRIGGPLATGVILGAFALVFFSCFLDNQRDHRR